MDIGFIIFFLKKNLCNNHWAFQLITVNYFEQRPRDELPEQRTWSTLVLVFQILGHVTIYGMDVLFYFILWLDNIL